MSSKAVSKKQPVIQKSLFATYNKNFQLKVYQHEVIDEHGNVKLVSNKISSSKPNCVEHILDISELHNLETRKKLEKEKAKYELMKQHEANIKMREEERKKRGTLEELNH